MKTGAFYLVMASAFCISGFTGCSKELPVQPVITEKNLNPVEKPGGFGISYLRGLSKTREITEIKSGESNVNFDLGSLKGSTAFYFLLYNIGGKPITDVKLHVADSGFAIFPSTIDTLIPGGDIGMLPVVKVSAYHGTAIDGAGTRPVMPMGENRVALVIEGATKTIDGNDTLVRMTAELKLNALVMDIEMKGDSGRIIDLTYSPCGVIGSIVFEGFDVINPRKYCLSDEKIVIINTGNVPITLKYFDPFDKNRPSITKIMQPGDSLDVELIRGVNIAFSLNGGNVVAADYRKMRTEDNGVCYFVAMKFYDS